MHPDLPQEQAYFDRALALRDRQHAVLERAPSLAAHPKATIELRRRVSGLGVIDPDEAVAFGRIEGRGQRWYIGKGAIWDDDNDLVVVNWQAPIAAPFYTATPHEPEGLDARRVYQCRGNQIQAIEEVVFRDLADAIVNGRQPGPVLSDALLESLGSDRSGELAEIVATIQAAQYDVISRDIDQLLVVQGGPGTGKTVVGLHRVSWLLFNRRDRLGPNDVLIVGPNPAFVRYISSVLPSLGDEAVVQLPLAALGPRVRVGRVDPPKLRRLKGDLRMVRLLERGVRNRQRTTSDDVELEVAGRRVQLSGRRIANRARQLLGRPHNEAHRELRAFVVDEARRQLTQAGLHHPAVHDITSHGESGRAIANYLDRVWPQLTPQAFLVQLLSSRHQLVAAALGTLRDDEIEMLALPPGTGVSTWLWSVDDIPLLDAADGLLNGRPVGYEHIVVDEAQDLSPLQLESIRRRSRSGSMTILGDLAQATSPWAHESWNEVVDLLRHEGVPTESVELELGYRLPGEVHEVAMRLLPEVAPSLRSPQAVRQSGHDVVVCTTRPDEVIAGTVAAIRSLLGTGLLGVVCPAALRVELGRGLDADGLAWSPELRAATAPIVVLSADEVKGLEFDSVVVVEPAQIVAEAQHGLRSLFVAVTRCTSRLSLVHAQPLPAQLGLEPVELDDGAELEAEAAHGPDGDRSDGVGAPRPAGTGVDLVADVPPAVEPAVEPPAVAAETVAAPPVVAESAVAEPAVAEPAVVPPEPVVPEPVVPEPVVPEPVAVDGAPSGDGDEPPPSEVPVPAASGAGDMTGIDDDDPRGAIVVDLLHPPADGDLAPRVIDVTEPGAAFAGLERDVARAIAAALAERIEQSVPPSLLPLVTDELARRLAVPDRRRLPGA